MVNEFKMSHTRQPAARFDLAPPGAIWYRLIAQVSNAGGVLISLPPEQFGIVTSADLIVADAF